MTTHPLARSRREFLQHGVGAATGLAAVAVTGTPALAAADERFELSIHQYSLKKLFDDGQLDTFGYAAFVREQFGFSNIEFAVEFCEQLKADPKQAEVIRKKSAELGVKHRALLCGAAPVLDASSEKERQAAVDEHLQWATVAERLGCEFIRVRASSEGERGAQLDYAASGIGALCDALNDASVAVLVENIAGFSRDPDWLIELVSRVGKERLGLISDFGNFEGDIYAGMEKLLPYSKSVCTKSWEFDEQGNETKIDFERMMRIIKASDFRGCIAIEYLGEKPVEGVKQTAALVNRFI